LAKYDKGVKTIEAQRDNDGMMSISIEIKRLHCRSPTITRNGKKTTTNKIAVVKVADISLSWKYIKH
jgi:hypothetical protein